MIRARIFLPQPEAGEKIEFLLRRHGLVLLAQSLLYSILLFVPLLLLWFINEQFADLWQNTLVQPVLVLLGSIYMLFIVLFWFTAFIDYWLDVWIVTNERIISVEQQGIFSRKFAEQKLYRLQDVSSEVEGFFPTILHYGTVIVQSAATEQTAILEQIPKADVVAREVMELAEDSKRRHGIDD